MNKKTVILLVFTLFMWYTGIKGTMFVLSNPDFAYNGLPLWGVHCILAGYLLIGVAITIMTISSWAKSRHSGHAA
ncbi:MAG TPA: hypothetical protein H9702_09135 [Candidatus Merdibacter merdavium]|uniref:Uncharacterized protein n=1 Tax=Candidatus Merdibacter merdavium TaxID=2838692 RepID=A0A9D2SW36_9FIRM|nr:hypothetical protein [Candidatus Merdibacter merdavium]